jgi:hypothetical protein
MIWKAQKESAPTALLVRALDAGGGHGNGHPPAD